MSTLLILLTLFANDGPDLVLVGGRVFTGVKDSWFAEALAIRGDRIVAVGKQDEIQALMQPGTDVIDLGGKVVVPSFVDTQSQLWLAPPWSVLDLSQAKTFGEVGKLLEKYALEIASDWIEGKPFDLSDLPEGTVPDRKMIDKIVSDRAVVLWADGGEAAWLNSVALERLKIERGTADPAGGRIERNAQGEPTGWLVGAAARLARRQQREPYEGEIKSGLLELKARAFKVGITALHSPILPVELTTLASMMDWGDFPFRVVAWPRVAGVGAQLMEATQKLEREHKASASIRIQAPLVRLDGMFGGRTAALLQPYADAKGTSGVLASPADAAALVKRANETGFAVAIEATGDAAVRAALDAIAAVPEKKRQRNVILHPMLIDAADLPRFAALGVVAAMQPGFIPQDIDKNQYLDARLGAERAARLQPIKSLLASGAVVAFGSNGELGPIDPLMWIYGAVARQSPEGKPKSGWGAGERITVEEAFRAASYGGACAAKAERDRGTLEKGKLADLVVLSKDPFGAPPSELLETRVEIVVQAGKVVYQLP